MKTWIISFVLLSASWALAQTYPASSSFINLASPPTIGGTTPGIGDFSAHNCGVLNTTACVLTGFGSTSGTATLTWPAVAGTTTNPIVSSNAFSAPVHLATATTNQFITGTSTNLSTLNFPASSGAVTLTFPNTTEYMLGAASDTTTAHVLHATTVAGVGSF